MSRPVGSKNKPKFDDELDELTHGVTTHADAVEIIEKVIGPDTLTPGQYMDLIKPNRFSAHLELRLYFAVLVEALNCIGRVPGKDLLAAIETYNRSLVLNSEHPWLPPGKTSSLRLALKALIWLTDDADQEPMSAAGCCDVLDLHLGVLRLAVIRAVQVGKRWRYKYMAPTTRRPGRVILEKSRAVHRKGLRTLNRRFGQFHAPIVKRNYRQSVAV